VCLDRALGNVKIASDFGVVTSLEQELDNLSFPGSHLFELFFHKTLHLPNALHPRQWRFHCGFWVHLD
jgi:hypothetical protein